MPGDKVKPDAVLRPFTRAFAYPETWRKESDFGDYWIKDHIDCCARADKPALLEEYGLKEGTARKSVYQSWLDAIYNQGGAADLFWMLAAEQDDGTLYPVFNQFTLYRSAIPKVILTHAAQMTGRGQATANGPG